MIPAEIAHEQHHAAADRAEKLYAVHEKDIEAETERLKLAKIESPDYWRERLEGIDGTEQVCRALAAIMGAKLNSACDGNACAVLDITIELSRLQSNVFRDLHDDCEEAAEREILS